MNFGDTSPWLAAAAGGVLIGAAAVLLMYLLGRIAGISGIAAGLLSRTAQGDRGWRLAFLLGLVAAGFLLKPLASATAAPAASLLLLVAAGLLVGFGSVLGSGCTSGHGVCGLGRRSLRSLVATVVFMLAGLITVFIARHVRG
ncbi:MAG TPA: YeeE/YedE thiosulfate transporter family protein [Usitatibacteraceae bacterium]